MRITDQNQARWEALYNSAIEFRNFKPWNHFDDSYIFGVRDPWSDEIGWCVIMGNGGIVYGLAVYTGKAGFLSYENMIYSFEEEDGLGIALSQKCLKVEFDDRGDIEDTDREIYEKLGLRFRGRNQYPVIRRSDPGYYPWPLESEAEVVFLTHCLDQSIHAVQLALAGKITLSNMDDDELLVMVPKSMEAEDTLTWDPVLMPRPETEQTHQYVPDPFLVNRIKHELPKKDAVLFLALDFIATPVQEYAEQRPFFPRLALWVDGESGLIAGNYTYAPQNIWKEFQADFLELINKVGYIPESIGINSPMGMEFMDVYGDLLDVDLVYAPEHPLFAELRSTFQQFF